MQPGAQHESHTHVSPDHPALPGHFPGAPIVPGVLLLDRVLDCAESWLGHALAPTGLAQVKFLVPFLPGEEAQLSLELADTNLKFIVRRGGEAIAAGVFSLAPVVAAYPPMKSEPT